MRDGYLAKWNKEHDPARNDGSFANWLEKNMQARGWTQADLARESGLSRQVVSYYMGHKSKYPSIEGIKAICVAFRVPISQALVTLGVLPRHDTNPLDEEALTLIEEMEPEDKQEAIEYLRYRLTSKKGGKAKKAKK